MKAELIIPEGWRQLNPREFRKAGDKILSGYINNLQWNNVTCFIGKATDNEIIIRKDKKEIDKDCPKCGADKNNVEWYETDGEHRYFCKKCKHRLFIRYQDREYLPY